MAIVELVQCLLHYLGFLGIVSGMIVFFIFQNNSLGNELLIGGTSFIVLKYAMGFIYETVPEYPLLCTGMNGYKN